MSRTSQIMGFSVPPAVVKEVEKLARQEHRTKSELFREMVRVYSRYRDQRDRDEERRIVELFEQVKAEEAKNPTSVEALLKESRRAAEYGAKQAKKMGIRTDMKSINRMIHEYRKARRNAAGRL